MPESSPDQPNPAAPRALVVVSALVLTEAVVLVGVALWSTIGLVTEGSAALGVALFLILACLGVAAALVAAERALRAGRRGGRAPVVTWQLLQAATGLTIGSAASGPLGSAAWVALAVALVVVVLMMTRAVVLHTVPRARQDGVDDGEGTEGTEGGGAPDGARR